MTSVPSVGASLVLVEQLLVILVVAHLLGLLTERLGLTAVVGELATGFVLGPSVFGTAFPTARAALFSAATAPFLDGIASVGLLLLLAVAGLEVDAGLLRRTARPTALVGVLGTAVPFALGFGFGWLLPASVRGSADPLVFSLFLAIALSISAIPVIARILLDLRALGGEIGQILVASAVLTDLLGWLVLGVVARAARDETMTPDVVVRSAAVLVAFVGVALVAGPRVVAAGRRYAPAIGGANRQVGVLVAAALGAGTLAVALGLEAFLGAFLLGIVIRQSGGLPPAVGERFESLTVGVFAPLFFGVAGLRADLTALGDPTVVLVGAGALAIALVGKFVGVYAGAVLAGRTRWEGITLGAGLNARGAIEIILATIGLQLGILTVGMYTVVLGVAIVTTALAPPLLRRSLRRVEMGSAFLE